MRNTEYTCDICNKEFRKSRSDKRTQEAIEEYIRKHNMSVTTVNIGVLFTLSWNADLCDECLCKYAPVTEEFKVWWRKK